MDRGSTHSLGVDANCPIYQANSLAHANESEASLSAGFICIKPDSTIYDGKVKLVT